tara:strand:- start:253 stop:390 length:138 start_codon:yes stop_codon:yes gene_type:complete
MSVAKDILSINFFVYFIVLASYLTGEDKSAKTRTICIKHPNIVLK